MLIKRHGLVVVGINHEREGRGSRAKRASGRVTCLLTRDQLFGESAARELKTLSTLGVVVVDLPQQRWQGTSRIVHDGME